MASSLPSSLPCEISAEPQKYDKTRLDSANRLALEKEIAGKELIIELIRNQTANLNRENTEKRFNIEEFSTKIEVMKEIRVGILEEKQELEVCVEKLKSAQVLAENRLSELQGMNRFYEENQDICVRNVAKMYAAVRAEEEICEQLLQNLAQKQEKEKQINSEIQEIGLEAAKEEETEENRYETEILQAENHCESLKAALEITEKQLISAQNNLQNRRMAAQKQHSAASMLESKLNKSGFRVSFLLPNLVIAVLLGVVCSLLLPNPDASSLGIH